MSEVWSNESVAKDHFAVAQVALCIFAVLQVVVALMTKSGAVLHAMVYAQNRQIGESVAITKDQALQRVREYLDRMGSTEFAGGYVVVESKTIEKRYGWVFVFNSKKYLETWNIIFSLGGNGPIVVERESGRLHQLGSALSLQDSVKQFEKANGFDYQ